jgi:hypothetical protein
VSRGIFCRLKDWRRIATGYDKLAANFADVVMIADSGAQCTVGVKRPPSKCGARSKETRRWRCQMPMSIIGRSRFRFHFRRRQ